jgi:hypothetical protein
LEILLYGLIIFASVLDYFRSFTKKTSDSSSSSIPFQTKEFTFYSGVEYAYTYSSPHFTREFIRKHQEYVHSIGLVISECPGQKKHINTANTVGVYITVISNKI